MIRPHVFRFAGKVGGKMHQHQIKDLYDFLVVLDRYEIRERTAVDRRMPKKERGAACFVAVKNC